MAYYAFSRQASTRCETVAGASSYLSGFAGAVVRIQMTLSSSYYFTISGAQ
jgi:hypothetical protein